MSNKKFWLSVENFENLQEMNSAIFDLLKPILNNNNNILFKDYIKQLDPIFPKQPITLQDLSPKLNLILSKIPKFWLKHEIAHISSTTTLASIMSEIITSVINVNLISEELS